MVCWCSARTPSREPLQGPRYTRKVARYGDVVGIRSYVRSGAFHAAFVGFRCHQRSGACGGSRCRCQHPHDGLDPERRHSVMLAYAATYALCEAKAKQPLSSTHCTECPHVCEVGELVAQSCHVGETRGCLLTHQRSRAGGTTPWGDSWCRPASQAAIFGSAHNRYGPERPVEARRLAFPSGGPSLASSSRRPLSRGP